MVVVAAADCGGGGDAHLYVAVVLVVGVKFYLACTYFVPGRGADAHRLTMMAISQGHTKHNYRVAECIRFNKSSEKNPTLHYPFRYQD